MTKSQIFFMRKASLDDTGKALHYVILASPVRDGGGCPLLLVLPIHHIEDVDSADLYGCYTEILD